MTTHAGASPHFESRYAWARLVASLAVMTVGGVGMYVMSVALPLVQAELGATRAEASRRYTLTMVGFGTGGVLTGRLADRYGVFVPALVGAASFALGFVASATAHSLWQFCLLQGVFIGLLGTGARRLRAA
jgi:MFS family permease